MLVDLPLAAVELGIEEHHYRRQRGKEWKKRNWNSRRLVEKGRLGVFVEEVFHLELVSKDQLGLDRLVIL